MGKFGENNTSFSKVHIAPDPLKFVSATFLLVCFVYLKGSTFETKNAFYFTSKVCEGEHADLDKF